MAVWLNTNNGVVHAVAEQRTVCGFVHFRDGDLQLDPRFDPAGELTEAYCERLSDTEGRHYVRCWHCRERGG